MTRVIQKGHEAEFQVETANILVNRVDFHRPNANLLREVLDTTQGVDQEVFAQPLSLNSPIDGEASQEDDRDIDRW